MLLANLKQLNNYGRAINPSGAKYRSARVATHHGLVEQ